MNFLESQTLLISFLKFFGFFTYKIKSDGSIDDNSRFYFTYSVIVNSFNHVFFVTVHIHFAKLVDNYLEDKNHVTELVTSLEAIAVELCCAILYYSIMFCRRPQIKFLREIAGLEREIRSINRTQCDYNLKMRRDSLVIITVNLVFHVSSIIYYIVIIPRSNMFKIYVFETINYVTFSIFLIFIIQFMENLVSTMGNLFDELNKILKHLITACPFHFSDKDLTAVFKLHDRMVASIENFNESFGVIALGIYIFVFGICTFEVYFAYGAIFNSFKPMDLNVALNVFGNICSFIPLFFTFCKLGFTCERVQEKVFRLISSVAQ